MPGRLKGMIPTDIKLNYLKALISAGFKHIDAVSFVSPKAVPQMADSEDVLKELDPPDDVEIIGIVVNEKGAQSESGDSTVFADEVLDDEILQVPDTPAAANPPATDPAQGVTDRIRSRHPRLRACSVAVQ